MRFGIRTHIGAFLILALSFFAYHPARAEAVPAPLAKFAEILQPFVVHHHRLAHHALAKNFPTAFILVKSERETAGIGPVFTPCSPAPETHSVIILCNLPQNFAFVENFFGRSEQLRL